jgi:hypothetical protein
MARRSRATPRRSRPTSSPHKPTCPDATDLNNAVIAANAGDYTGAATDAQAGNTASSNGNAELAAATTDVTNYTVP